MSFFESKKAAAIFKHAILDQYIGPFVGMTGKYSPGNRVAFIDGYAGEGRYVTGDEGSPSLLMRKARELRPLPRILECFFVEEDPDVFGKLLTVIEAEAGESVVRPHFGTVAEHLPRLLKQAEGVPLLLFLDPFGLMIPFSLAIEVFTARPAGPRAPATEVLINFNVTGLRRIAGHLASEKASEASLRSMDVVFGGPEWREIWAAAPDRDAAEVAVVYAYARKFAQAAGAAFWMAPVRNRAHHKPIYYLIFLTRHADGMTKFAEALSLGMEKWRRAVHDIEDADSLFGDEDAFTASEAALADGWIKEIEANLRRELASGVPFAILDRYNAVFGTAMGLAREKHLRAAWRTLYKEGVTKTDPKGDLIKNRKPIEPA